MSADTENPHSFWRRVFAFGSHYIRRARGWGDLCRHFISGLKQVELRLIPAAHLKIEEEEQNLDLFDWGKMHDFCFTLPYGFVILVGGLIGFLRKGSTSSLLGGLGSGLLLLLAGKLSLGAYHKGQNSWFAILLETVISLAVTLVMGQRYKMTAKFMPPGLVFFMGGIMTMFYFYKIATGGNHIVKKDKPS